MLETRSGRRGFVMGVGAVGAALLARGGRSEAEEGDASLLTAVTFIHGLPGKEAELQEHLLSLTAPTRAEPGCLRYDLYQHPEKKNEFMRYEIWRSPEDLEAHKKTPHLRASFERRQREGWTTEITVWKRLRD